MLTGEERRAAPAHHGVQIIGARVTGHLNLSQARVAAPVQLLKSLFEDEVDLNDARFEAGLSLEKSAFRGGIKGDALHVEGSLVLVEASVHGEHLRLVGAKITGDLRMERAALTVAALPWWGLHVDGSLNLIGSRFPKTAVLEIVDARIGKSLILAETVLPASLDLSGTTVGEELRLGWPSASLGPPIWGRGARLVLRAARVGAFQDMDGDVPAASWPCGKPGLDLQGFTYNRLVSTSISSSTPPPRTGAPLNPPKGNAMLERNPSWFVKYWLACDPTFTRQPYQQLASVLRAAGAQDRAEAVIYAARDRELVESWRNGDYLNTAVLWLLKVTIGYGLGGGYFRAVVWVLGFTGLGMLVLQSSPEAESKGPAWRFGASLDHLLPIVELNKEFSDFFHDPDRKRLSSWQFYYFAFLHAPFGYVLGGSVVAGLAGLTQANQW